MNFYNPYNSFPYYTASMTRQGLFGRMFGGIKFSSIVSGTQKTLSIINQAIPVIKQATPIIRNSRTMLKVMNEFKKVDTPTTNNDIRVHESTTKQLTTPHTSDATSANGPTFFL